MHDDDDARAKGREASRHSSYLLSIQSRRRRCCWASHVRLSVIDSHTHTQTSARAGGRPQTQKHDPFELCRLVCMRAHLFCLFANARRCVMQVISASNKFADLRDEITRTRHTTRVFSTTARATLTRCVADARDSARARACACTPTRANADALDAASVARR